MIRISQGDEITDDHPTLRSIHINDARVRVTYCPAPPGENVLLLRQDTDANYLDDKHRAVLDAAFELREALHAILKEN